MISDHLSRALADRARSLKDCPTVEAEQIEIEIPKDRGHGDLSANLALVLSSRVRRNPRELAEELLSVQVENQSVINEELEHQARTPGHLLELEGVSEVVGQDLVAVGKVTLQHGLPAVGVVFGEAQPSWPALPGGVIVLRLSPRISEVRPVVAVPPLRSLRDQRHPRSGQLGDSR